MTIPQALDLAVERHRLGRLGEAEAIYRQILAIQPNHADALYLLGMIAGQAGRAADGAGLIRRAIALNPAQPSYHLELGNALAAQGQWEDAIRSYRAALQLQPGLAMACNNMGAAQKALGSLDDAIASYRAALQLQPDYADCHSNLAVALQEKGAYDEAIAACQCALRWAPAHREAWYHLGISLEQKGNGEGAIDAYRRALRNQPAHLKALLNLGVALGGHGRHEEAIAACREALKLKPDFTEAIINLGELLLDQGNIEEALAWFREQMTLWPAAAAIRCASVAALHFSPSDTPESLLEAHVEYDRLHAAPLRASRLPHRHVCNPERRLRVGFVSAHFANHPVGRFLVRPLENLDHERFHITCYSDTFVEDAMSSRLRRAAAAWVKTSALSDDQLAQRIVEDEIDILFDLAGHTARNRLGAFARKPAPIQITWLDYAGTTGLQAMDFILADAHEIPPGDERFYREQVLRMPDGYLCFDPPEDSPDVSPLPALAAGRITFGSFNALPKISRQIVEVWAKILHRLPTSRLILKNRGLDRPKTIARLTQWFRAHGITGDRIDFRGWSPSRELLATYREVDLALDTAPFGGGLTTCEALWMGVPVITHPGRTFASRHALSHLTAAGLTETVAGSFDEYVALATEWASDLPKLTTLRSGMRERVANSPLCDGKRFAENLATILREVWRKRSSHQGCY